MYLEVKDMKKSYGKDTSYIQVLKGITTSVERGQMCVIQGTSGNGKSTLLNCIGGLDTMDSGSVKVDGKEIFGLKPDTLETLSDKGVMLSEIAPQMVAGISSAYDGSKKLAEGTDKLTEKTDKLIDEIFDFKIENLTYFVVAADNPRILAAAGDMQMNRE